MCKHVLFLILKHSESSNAVDLFRNFGSVAIDQVFAQVFCWPSCVVGLHVVATTLHFLSLIHLRSLLVVGGLLPTGKVTFHGLC